MDDILRKIAKMLTIPDIEQAIELKVKELEHQFKNQLDNMRRTMITETMEKTEYFEFILKKKGESWEKNVSLTCGFSDKDVLPEGIKDYIVSHHKEISRIYLLEQKLFSPRLGVHCNYLIRYVAESHEKIIGTVVLSYKKKAPPKDSLKLKFDVIHLSPNEIKIFEGFIHALLSNKSLREATLHNYTYKLKELYGVGVDFLDHVI